MRRGQLKFGVFVAAGAMAAVITGTTPAAAALLTFESLAANQTGGVPNGNPLVEDGFRLTKLTGSLDFYAFQDGWQSGRGSSNGTTVLGSFSNACCLDEFKMEAVNGNPFTLLSIDLAEFVKPADFGFAGVARTVTFTGHYNGGGTVTTSFTLDLASDGPGGIADFQTFAFSAAWANLLSVNVAGSNPANQYGTYMYFDNIAVEAQVVPEPGTMTLLGLAAICLRRRLRRRGSR